MICSLAEMIRIARMAWLSLSECVCRMAGFPSLYLSGIGCFFWPGRSQCRACIARLAFVRMNSVLLGCVRLRRHSERCVACIVVADVFVCGTVRLLSAGSPSERSFDSLCFALILSCYHGSFRPLVICLLLSVRCASRNSLYSPVELVRICMRNSGNVSEICSCFLGWEIVGQHLYGWL